MKWEFSSTKYQFFLYAHVTYSDLASKNSKNAPEAILIRFTCGVQRCGLLIQMQRGLSVCWTQQ